MDLELPKGSLISCSLRSRYNNATFPEAYFVSGPVLGAGGVHLVLAANELSLCRREGLQGQDNTGAIRAVQRR